MHSNTRLVCKRGHSRTPENVLSNRACRLCQRASQRKKNSSNWDRTLRRGRARYKRNRTANLKRAKSYFQAHPELHIYIAAKARCTNPKNKDWKHYGGRGIKFLFKSFREFLAHIGPRPAGKTLDRIKNDGHYEPGNVRWATWKEQAANRR
jgi:hypothetical protein